MYIYIYICIYLYIIANTNITCDHLLRSLYELATPCTKRRVFGVTSTSRLGDFRDKVISLNFR